MCVCVVVCVCRAGAGTCERARGTITGPAQACYPCPQQRVLCVRVDVLCECERTCTRSLVRRAKARALRTCVRQGGAAQCQSLRAHVGAVSVRHRPALDAPARTASPPSERPAPCARSRWFECLPACASACGRPVRYVCLLRSGFAASWLRVRIRTFDSPVAPWLTSSLSDPCGLLSEQGGAAGAGTEGHAACGKSRTEVNVCSPARPRACVVRARRVRVSLCARACAE